jgi:hypothetical protein
MTARGEVGVRLIAASVLTVGVLTACTSPDADHESTDSATAPASSSASATAGGPSGEGPSTGGESPSTCGPPTLHILAPADNSTVTTPFELRFEVECFPRNPEDTWTILMSTDGLRVPLHPSTTNGTVDVSDHPLLSGRRTVTFQLAERSGPLTDASARVVVHLTIEGSR